MAAYSVIDTYDADRRLSGKSETENVHLADDLGFTEMRPRVWFLEPGHDRKGRHYHERQEELYLVLRGEGRMTVDGDDLTVPEGGAVRVPAETTRRMFNDTDEETVWLVVGAPPIPNDGVQC